MKAYLRHELETPILDAIYQYLCLTGLPRNARPLHRQILMGRHIVVTEDPNEHLVWYEKEMFLKPLPDSLLSNGCWETYICSDESLYRSACGLMLLFVWLVGHRSDFQLTKEPRLLSEGIE